MATDLRPNKSATPEKYESFAEVQLARARNRVRLLDLGAAFLGLLGLTLAYGLLVALCDRWLELPALVRQAAFAFYVLGALAYFAWAVVLPLSRQINPYYAARQLEQTLPGAKNSVVNWLDLRHESLPVAIHAALSRRPAN